jgi:hypothetical protein
MRSSGRGTPDGRNALCIGLAGSEMARIYASAKRAYRASAIMAADHGGRISKRPSSQG